MKKDLGVQPALYPMPVLMIATYNEARGAFTLSVADVAHLDESDYFGIASGNKVADKFERTGMTAVRSERVDAPVVQEYPITLECSVVEMQDQPYGLRVLGRIENVVADDAVLDESSRVDPARLNAFAFDQFQSGYYAMGEKVGQAWESGKRLA